MGKILTYSSMFEGKESDDKIKEFNQALESPEGKDFQKWFWAQHVRTGRSYISKEDSIKGIYIPSRSYFDKDPDSEEWYFEFSSSNGTYGTTYNKDLKSLFREFMITAVRKSRPSSITENQIKEFFSKESNSPIGNFPSPEEIYSSILDESGFITDFRFLLDLPIVKRAEDLGAKVYPRETSGLISITIDFLYAKETILETLFGKEYSDSLKEIVKNIPPPPRTLGEWGIQIFDNFKPILIEPKSSPGSKVYKGRQSTELRLGFDSKEKIEKYVEKFIVDTISLVNPIIRSAWNDKFQISPLADLIKKSILGEPTEKLKEESKERIGEIALELIGPEIEKNPFDLYLLDEMPEVKKKAMEKYGIEKDFSKLGKALGKGFL